METVQVAIADLVLDEDNPREGSLPDLIASLQEFGQHRPVVVRRDTKKVIAGNHLVKSATALGWDEVAVMYVDDDDKKALRRAIADNAVGDKARFNEPQLASLMLEAGSDIPGIDERMQDRLRDMLKTKDEPEKPVYEVNPEPGEKYDYILVVAKTEIDVTWLESLFGRLPKRSYKSSSVGRSRIVMVETLQRLIIEQSKLERDRVT